MKQRITRRLCYAIAICLVLQSALFQTTIAQVQTPRYVDIGTNCHGFYEYLPQGYSSGSQDYPLIIFMHGTGELGNGTSDLPRVLNNGIPRIINSGAFPTYFTVNSNTYRYIVLSPQFVNGWPTSQDLDAVITYATQNYRVDKKRVYLTGLSMGGGVIWYYITYSKLFADKIAAAVIVCGGTYLSPPQTQIIANANIAVWATQNDGDPIAPLAATVNNVTLINASNPPPATLAKMSIFQATSHDAWTKTYNPTFEENGLNIYEWMLQYQQAGGAVLPVVMGDYKAFLLADNSSIGVSWKTLSETNNRYFSIEKSKDGTNFSLIDTVSSFKDANGHSYSFTDVNPLKGNNFYRLSQTDLDGKTTYFNILKVIVPEKNQNTFRINPNPVINSFQLEWVNQEKGPVTIILSDMQGQVLKSWRSDKQSPVWQQRFDASQIPPGTYTIQLKSNNNTETQRFIKQ